MKVFPHIWRSRCSPSKDRNAPKKIGQRTAITLIGERTPCDTISEIEKVWLLVLARPSMQLPLVACQKLTKGSPKARQKLAFSKIFRTCSCDPISFGDQSLKNHASMFTLFEVWGGLQRDPRSGSSLSTEIFDIRNSKLEWTFKPMRIDSPSDGELLTLRIIFRLRPKSFASSTAKPQ